MKTLKTQAVGLGRNRFYLAVRMVNALVTFTLILALIASTDKVSIDVTLTVVIPWFWLANGVGIAEVGAHIAQVCRFGR